MYDIVHTPGVAADLSHIETAAKVKAANGPNELKVYYYFLFTKLFFLGYIAKRQILNFIISYDACNFGFLKPVLSSTCY